MIGTALFATTLSKVASVSTIGMSSAIGDLHDPQTGAASVRARSMRFSVPHVLHGTIAERLDISVTVTSYLGLRRCAVLDDRRCGTEADGDKR